MVDRTPTETALDTRRRELGRSWKEIYNAARISHTTLGKLRLEETVSPETEDAVEDVLALERGSLAAVRRTRDPEAIVRLASPTPMDRRDGVEWLDRTPLPGGGVEWKLTRIIDGRPASFTLADFDNAAEAEIREELREVMNDAEIRQRRRLARQKSR